MRNKKGFWLIAAGLLCVAAALVIFLFNTMQSRQAQASSERIVSSLSEQILLAAETSGQLPADNPDRSMPKLSVEGEDYVGILEIPALALTLPVRSALTDEALQITPCLYSGSVYRDNAVVGAHNYDAHFGSISSLRTGDEVIFTDVENHRFSYAVVSIEALRADQNKELIEKQSAADWDFTLFTCNYTGSARITVRCKRV